MTSRHDRTEYLLSISILMVTDLVHRQNHHNSNNKRNDQPSLLCCKAIPSILTTPPIKLYSAVAFAEFGVVTEQEFNLYYPSHAPPERLMCSNERRGLRHGTAKQDIEADLYGQGLFQV